MGKLLHHWHCVTKKRLKPELILLALILVTGNAFAALPAHAGNGISSNAAKPPITITGTVVDAKGDPLPGVTVKAKNGTGASVTTVDGAFKINVENDAETLVFTFIGYKTVEMPVAGKTSLRVTLEADVSHLDDVVVIGFGAVKKRDLTGAVSSVKTEEITARPGPNPMESLQGRVAGLDITRTSGQPGQGVNLQLRGNRSFTASGNPLFIINGLPGDYATLNANDIESIDVLKDAASTAAYGSAGANGVVIITTKSGKAGKLNVDFNSYYGYNGWSITPEVLTGEDYLQAKRDAFSYVWDVPTQKWTTTGAQWQSPANDEAIFGPQRYAIYQQGQFVNWADEFLRKNSGTQNYSLGVSGGTDATKAYISFNLQDEQGQYRGDDYRLYSTNIRIDHKIRKWVSIGGNLQASYVDRNKAQDKLENALVTDPLVRPYRADGTINPDLGNNVYNLLLDYQPGVYGNVENNTRVFFNPYIELRPIKGLTILSRASVQMNYLNNYRFDGIGSVSYTYSNGGIAKARINQNRFFGTQWENVLTYNFKVLKDHEFTFTGVTSFYNNRTTETEMNQSNITSNNFKWYKFTGDVNSTSISSYSMQKTFGLLGRINYSYLGKYLLSASIRRDGSSVLYATNQYDNFPAVSVGWRVSDEKFMAFSKNWLDNLKLRASWGVAGTAKINPYSSQLTVEQNNMSLGGETQPIFRYSGFLTNADLHWEKSKNLNFGLDATLFKNRIDLTMEYFRTITDGVIYSVQSPIIYGTYRSGTQYQTNINVAKTRNEGLEVTLNTRNIVGKNFEWTSSAAFSFNTDRILKIVGGLSNNISNTGTPYTLSLGQPVNSFWNYKLDGVWQIGEEADAAAFAKRPGDLKVNVPGMTKLAPGVFSKTLANGTTAYYYTNLTEARKFNPALTAASATYNYSSADYQVVGHNNPNWSLGFQNQFKYKNFDLTVYTYMRWGQTISYNMMGWYQPSAFAINASPSRTFPSHFNYWTPTNPSNEFPVMNYLASPSTMVGFSGLNYVDGSFFKIKNITLGYTLPANLAKKVSIQRLRFYATVTNPLVVAKSHLLKNYDPEMNGTLDYPLTKQAVLGVNLTF